jgi:hypothetical protein
MKSHSLEHEAVASHAELLEKDTKSSSHVQITARDLVIRGFAGYAQASEIRGRFAGIPASPEFVDRRNRERTFA